VRWQGWPILPPLHFREEAISLKLVHEKFSEVELPLYGVLRSSRDGHLGRTLTRIPSKLSVYAVASRVNVGTCRVPPYPGRST
jgi:hypothetical protein